MSRSSSCCTKEFGCIGSGSASYPALFMISLFTLLSLSCSVDTHVLPENIDEDPLQKPSKIGIVRLDTLVFVRTAGGILEPNYEHLSALQTSAPSTVKQILQSELPGADVIYPVKSLQRSIDQYSYERQYLDNVIHSLKQVHFAKPVRTHLAEYPLPDRIRSLRERNFSHLLVFSATGAVASPAKTALEVQRLLVFSALGGSYIPVFDFGQGYVLILNLQAEQVRFYNQIVNPRAYTMTDEEEIQDLLQTLLTPYFEQLQKTGTQE